jgi:hypothetical protein
MVPAEPESDLAHAPHMIAKLGLNHHDRGLNVAPLVIVREELLPVKREVVEHLLPRTTPVSTCRGLLEGYVGRRIDGRDRLKILGTGIAFVGQDFIHLKVFGSLVNQGWQKWCVASVLPVNLYGCDYVGFYPAHDVSLDPIMLLPNNAILFVKPASETGGHKASRIHGEVSFDGFERQCALDNQVHQYGCQIGILKVVKMLL